ncbi:MAG: hypothetical protein AB7V56_11835 [Candidatus Nitrosocosmicus sp.]
MKESVLVQMKERDTCVVEASDGIPGSIGNCPYQIEDNITVSYKQGYLIWKVIVKSNLSYFSL